MSRAIVDAAAHRPAGDDFGHVADDALEAVEIGLAVVGQRHLHQYGGDRRDGAHRDPGMIAGDDAGLFQLAQPHPARRRRQADLVGERQLGDAPVALDHVEDFEVDLIEFRCGHERPLSSMTP
ncbi:hypothetical protein A9K71_21220 [Mesorhizobium sp. WSM3873]|nr:hypothetical protein A9K71_21220 [Mesorhizobium sp. WSM3873]